jgi:hypothetical protein
MARLLDRMLGYWSKLDDWSTKVETYLLYTHRKF